jgi:dTDP-4-dehydrorhamnose reductase
VPSFDKAIVLGSSGMLGSSVFRAFQSESIQVIGLNRKSGFDLFLFEQAEKYLLDLGLDEGSLIINCVGWIPQRATGYPQVDTLNAILANSLLPNLLEKISFSTGASTMQILTDCVFKGDRGNYLESDEQNASDLYGLSKRLGEIGLSRTMGVRCSIVGFSPESSSSLFDWFLSHPPGAEVEGFNNHFWNGVTTKAFAALALGVFKFGAFTPGKHHWMPADSVSKFELLQTLQKLTGRVDLVLLSRDGKLPTDRRLSSELPDYSQYLWRIAGFSEVPSIFELIVDLVNDDPSYTRKGSNGSQNRRI